MNCSASATLWTRCSRWMVVMFAVAYASRRSHHGTKPVAPPGVGAVGHRGVRGPDRRALAGGELLLGAEGLHRSSQPHRYRRLQAFRPREVSWLLQGVRRTPRLVQEVGQDL